MTFSEELRIRRERINQMAKDLERTGMLESYDHCAIAAQELVYAGYCKQSEGGWLLKWESTFPQYEPSKYQCSICGSVRTARYEYCPNCGAKMKGE